MLSHWQLPLLLGMDVDRMPPGKCSSAATKVPAYVLPCCAMCRAASTALPTFPGSLHHARMEPRPAWHVGRKPALPQSEHCRRGIPRKHSLAPIAACTELPVSRTMRCSSLPGSQHTHHQASPSLVAFCTGTAEPRLGCTKQLLCPERGAWQPP